MLPLFNSETRLVHPVIGVIEPLSPPFPPSLPLDYSLFAIAAFYAVRHLFSNSAKQDEAEQELIKQLVENLLATNKQLLEANQILTLRVGGDQHG